MTRVQIKICGVTNVKDAKACAELGASMIGFNFYPQSPRYIEPRVARRIIEAIPPGVCAVGVFVDASAEEIRNVADAAGVRCVQLHGRTLPDSCSELAREFRLIRAFSTDAQFQAEQVSLFSDCDVLIDAHHPNLRGGTGLTCDWRAARTARTFARFLILSGGLTDQNVGQAIAAVAPHAVDVCSGVESAPGVKNPQALKDLCAAVRTANPSINAPGA
jgi:phosphoribosylanthranilate isomerase